MGRAPYHTELMTHESTMIWDRWAVMQAICIRLLIARIQGEETEDRERAAAAETERGGRMRREGRVVDESRIAESGVPSPHRLVKDTRRGASRRRECGCGCRSRARAGEWVHLLCVICG